MSGDKGNGSGKYPHREFWVPAHDSKGHTERIQIRLQPELAGRVQKILACKIWPYENTQEIVRHAIKRHMDWLEHEQPKCGNLMAQINAMNLQLYEEEQHQVMQATYDRMRKTFAENDRIGGAVARARNLAIACDMRDRIQRIEDKYWRSVWESKFAEEYNEVLDKAPAVEPMQIEEWDEEEEVEE